MCKNCKYFVRGFRETLEEPAEPDMCSKHDRDIDSIWFCLSYDKKEAS